VRAQLDAVRPIIAAAAVLSEAAAGWRRHYELEKNAAGSAVWLRR
jgi:hypothetical protein